MLRLTGTRKRAKLRMRFGSHLPVLMRCLELTDGPVLELGGGLYSTPFLHWACFRSGRHLVTMEKHEVYYEYLEQYRRDWHEVEFVEDWGEMNVTRMNWGIVLVDHDPLERRPIEARRVKDCAEYVVFHDATERGAGKLGYEGAFREFKERFLFDEVGAASMVLSNFRNLERFRVKV